MIRHFFIFSILISSLYGIFSQETAFMKLPLSTSGPHIERETRDLYFWINVYEYIEKSYGDQMLWHWMGNIPGEYEPGTTFKIHGLMRKGETHYLLRLHIESGLGLKEFGEIMIKVEYRYSDELTNIVGDAIVYYMAKLGCFQETPLAELPEIKYPDQVSFKTYHFPQKDERYRTREEAEKEIEKIKADYIKKERQRENQKKKAGRDTKRKRRKKKGPSRGPGYYMALDFSGGYFFPISRWDSMIGIVNGEIGFKVINLNFYEGDFFRLYFRPGFTFTAMLAMNQQDAPSRLIASYIFSFPAELCFMIFDFLTPYATVGPQVQIDFDSRRPRGDEVAAAFSLLAGGGIEFSPDRYRIGWYGLRVFSNLSLFEQFYVDCRIELYCLIKFAPQIEDD